MKKLVFRAMTFSVTALLILALVACGAGVAAEKTKIGFFAPLTGDAMQYGTMLSDGALLALEEWNRVNGTNYTVEVFDDKNDQREAVNIANRIVADPNNILGMGSYSSSASMAAAPVFEDAGMVLLSPSASHQDFPHMGEYMFSIVISQKYEGPGFAEAVWEQTGGGKLAVILQNTDWGVNASQLFVDRWTALGGEVLPLESFVPGSTTDYSPMLTKLRAQNPDILYVAANYDAAGQIFIQAENLGFEAQYVGPGLCLLEDFLEVLGGNAEGTIVLSSIPTFIKSVMDNNPQTDATRKFVADFNAKYGRNPNGFAAQGFDAMNIILGIIDEVGTDSDAIRDALAALRSYDGVSGFNMMFNDTKEMVKGIYVFEVKDNNFLQIKPEV